jgi:hypothetical protein
VQADAIPALVTKTFASLIAQEPPGARPHQPARRRVSSRA